MRKLLVLGLIGSMIIVACNSTTDKTETVAAATDELHEKASSIFKSISSLNLESPDEEMVKLGHYLYFDKGLSLDRNISCNSCHGLDNYGVDNLQFSPGDDGSLGDRNSPTVFHASLHTMQFWDGRAADVEEQAGGPILNPVEHKMKDEAQVVSRVKDEGFYDEMFANAFKGQDDPITFDNITKAIGAFERTLNPESRFDHYLDGDLNALNDQEKRGLTIFMDQGCITCHAGPALGGNMFQKFGLFGDYWEATKSENIDLGRYQETNKETDKYFFKVPGLRNILHTGPYFHDGSVSDLREAIQIMSRLQRDIVLTEEEIDDIMAFFNALTSDIPEETKKNPFD